MSFQCHLYKYNQAKWLKDGFMFLKHKETNNGSVSKVQNLDFYCGGCAKLTTGLKILSGFQSVCTSPSALCSLLPPFVSIPPQLISLMGLTCVSLLPRPLVYRSQAFLVLAATLSGLLTEQWFRIWERNLRFDRVFLVFCVLRFCLMILCLCRDFRLPSFWFWTK